MYMVKQNYCKFKLWWAAIKMWTVNETKLEQHVYRRCKKWSIHAAAKTTVTLRYACNVLFTPISTYQWQMTVWSHHWHHDSYWFPLRQPPVQTAYNAHQSSSSTARLYMYLADTCIPTSTIAHYLCVTATWHSHELGCTDTATWNSLPFIIHNLYTVGHKKRATFIFSITLANIDGFS